MHKDYALYNRTDSLGDFGGNCHIRILENARNRSDNYSNFGAHYELPAGIT
jgi:hypothetical protein